MSTGSEPFRICTACSPAATISPLNAELFGLQPHRLADRALEVRALAQRPFDARRGDLDRVVVEVRPQQHRDALAERVVDAFGMVDVDAEALLARDLEREHLGAGQRRLHEAADLALQLSLPLVLPVAIENRRFMSRNRPYMKNGRDAPISKSRNVVSER